MLGWLSWMVIVDGSRVVLAPNPLARLGILLDVIVVQQIGRGVDILALEPHLRVAFQGAAVFLLAHGTGHRRDAS
jgi:hypothetical protein